MDIEIVSFSVSVDGYIQARRSVFLSGAAERSEESERSEPRAERVYHSWGSGGAVSPPGGVRGDSPGKILELSMLFEVI